MIKQLDFDDEMPQNRSWELNLCMNRPELDDLGNETLKLKKEGVPIMRRSRNDRFTRPACGRIIAILAVAALAAAASGCGQSSSSGMDGSGTTTAVAVETVGGAVSSTSGDTISALTPKHPDTLLARLLGIASPISTALASAFGQCPTAEAPHSGTCSVTGNSMTLAFPAGGCTYSGGTGPIWSGGTVLTTESGIPSCGTYPILDGTTFTSITRTYTGNLLSSPTARTNEAGTNTVAIDTSAPSGTVFSSATSKSPVSGTIGWQYSIPSGGGYERSYVSGSTHNLTISVRLVDYDGSSTSGKVRYDHTLSTTDSSDSSTPLDITISGSGSSETQTVNGTLHVQHNLMKMTGSAEFNDVVHEKGCCYPISGTVTTTFSGGPNDGKHESMTFSDATCELGTLGQVEFTDINGNVSTKTLTQCM